MVRVRKNIDGCLALVLGSSHSFIFGLYSWIEWFADRNYMTHREQEI